MMVTSNVFALLRRTTPFAATSFPSVNVVSNTANSTSLLNCPLEQPNLFPRIGPLLALRLLPFRLARC